MIVDCNARDLVLDMPMQVVFRPLDFPEIEGEVLAPCFAPTGGAR